jgi:[pyruvate, water dikinase]-phosphate phosphotransferase / [pyruvate, water dikinase] kinase
MYHVFVTSDGTGRTAQQALNAALMQFPEVELEIHLETGVISKERVLEVVENAAKVNGIIIHTLVSEELRGLLAKKARVHNIETIDIMGPLLLRLSNLFSNKPSGQPGLFHQINKEYFQRIDAMQYAINHDDGQRTYELGKAEIVLAGVSRTFKTPLSIYLAYKGWFVANVPITLNMDPPFELFEVPPDRVFCLTTHPEELSRLRTTRQNMMGDYAIDYANLDFVRKEIIYAKQIYSYQPRWTTITVTYKSIEEIASEILALMRQKELYETDRF